MTLESASTADIGDAIRKVNALVKQAKAAGWNVLDPQDGEHLNPGDVYDAFEALPYTAVADDILESDTCGPLAAIYLYRVPGGDRDRWKTYVAETFDAAYAAGFRDGFRLQIPDTADAGDKKYIRGVYDGTMAHAAVF